MLKSFIKLSSILPLLVCFFMLILISEAIGQATVAAAGNAPGSALSGTRVATSQPGHQKLVTGPLGTVIPASKALADAPGNKTKVQSDPQGKQPPIPIQVKPHIGKRTYHPVVHVSPENLEKARKLLEKFGAGQGKRPSAATTQLHAPHG